MVEAKDLRLGNWVKNKHNEITQVFNLNDDGMRIHHKHTVSIDCEPIPLTTDILLGCGFEEKNTKTWFPYWQIEHTRVLVKYTFRISTMGEDEWRWIEGNVNVPFYYLHQLQNLYYSLTQKELVINL